ncbi:uncharacterized protein LOC118349676 [Juglans regia]|uniref:Uncharacterized protein LOC118349676 n=1 Tax=Juglans regia TaxID=51240 RepID=A0A6P9EV32_JUGRE|nr:uncharacterized protein LOC118349676 [Juglans regia]
MLIANYTIRQILIDNGSLADILFRDFFTRMGISPGKLRPSPYPLKGFSGETVQLVGSIAMPFTIGQGAHMATTMTNFLVVKTPLSYSTILGRPTLNDLKVVTSTYHLKMKLPTETSLNEVRGEQILARECYVQELKVGAPIVCTVDNGSKQSPPPPLVEDSQKIKARNEDYLV